MNQLITLACIVISLVVLSTSQKSAPKHIQKSWEKVTLPFKKKCAEETGLSEDLAKRLFLHSEYPEDEPLKCYIKCISAQMGLLDLAKGEWVLDEFLRQIAGLTPEIYAICNEEVKSAPNLCENAYGMYKCVVRHVSED